MTKQALGALEIRELCNERSRMKIAKFQTIKPKEIPMTNHQARLRPFHLTLGAELSTWSVKFGASLVFAAWCLVLPASAQYSIDWHKVAGGGGTTTNAQFSLSGTIGQPDAGALSGANYSLTGGFWSLVSAVQTPGAPLLLLSRTATNTVVISWPFPAAGFGLEENSSLGTTNWTSVTNAVQNNGLSQWVTVPVNSGHEWFRLKK